MLRLGHSNEWLVGNAAYSKLSVILPSSLWYQQFFWSPSGQTCLLPSPAEDKPRVKGKAQKFLRHHTEKLNFKFSCHTGQGRLTRNLLTQVVKPQEQAVASGNLSSSGFNIQKNTFPRIHWSSLLQMFGFFLNRGRWTSNLIVCILNHMYKQTRN